MSSIYNTHSSSSASHGTGTTVRVSNFLRNIPVRKQTALKHSSKILANVKKLLVDYAYARPTVRLQLKILKTPKEKSNWSFAPSADPGDLKSIASRIAPRDVVTQTLQFVRKSDDSGYGISGLFASPSEGNYEQGTSMAWLTASLQILRVRVNTYPSTGDH